MPIDAATTLPDGARLRIRLPHRSDRAAIGALLERLGLAAEELTIARALRFPPQERAVVCATAWVAGHPQVVGVGAIDLGAREPDFLLADEALAPGVGERLRGALRERSLRDVAA